MDPLPVSRTEGGCGVSQTDREEMPSQSRRRGRPIARGAARAPSAHARQKGGVRLAGASTVRQATAWQPDLGRPGLGNAEARGAQNGTAGVACQVLPFLVTRSLWPPREVTAGTLLRRINNPMLKMGQRAEQICYRG